MPIRTSSATPATPVATWCAMMKSRIGPPALSRLSQKLRLNGSKPEHIAEGLRQAEQAREDRQREIECAREQQPLQIHRIDGRSVGRSRLRSARPSRPLQPAPPRPNQLSELLRALQQDRLQDAFFLAGRAAGLELDPGEAEQPGERSLSDVDVLDPAERDRAMGPVQDAAVDADLVRPDAIFESPPVEEQPGRHEQDQQRPRRSAPSAFCPKRRDSRFRHSRLPCRVSDPPNPVSRKSGWRCSGGPTAASSGEVGSDMFADDVTDFGSPLR